MDRHQLEIADLRKYLHTLDMELKNLHARVQKLETAAAATQARPTPTQPATPHKPKEAHSKTP